MKLWSKKTIVAVYLWMSAFSMVFAQNGKHVGASIFSNRTTNNISKELNTTVMPLMFIGNYSKNCEVKIMWLISGDWITVDLTESLMDKTMCCPYEINELEEFHVVFTDKKTRLKPITSKFNSANW